MDNKQLPGCSQEGTPFVIDFKQRNQTSNYGSAESNIVPTIVSNNEPLSSRLLVDDMESHNVNNNNNSNNGMNLANDLNEIRGSSQIYCLHGHPNVQYRDHCHQQRSNGVDVSARKKLLIASALCLIFMIAEIIGGVLSNSLAIATDAAHLLTDFASFMISLFAIWIAGRPATQRMNFGWHRAEVIGALVSVVMIWAITAVLVWLAINRIIYRDFEVDAKIMLITSGLAILINVIMGFQLQHGHSHGLTPTTGHGHSHAPKKAKKNISFKFSTKKSDEHSTALSTESNGEISPSYQNSKILHENLAAVSTNGHAHESAPKEVMNMNVRAAFIHVLGDVVQSIGVFIAAIIIYFRPDYAIADPICTFIFSIIVLFTTFSIIKDALLVLMEGTPNYMEYNEVMEVLSNIEGVERVHNLRVWALSINKVALSAHLVTAPGADSRKILSIATAVVHNRYNFYETTIQIEEYTPQMEDCEQCETI